MGEGAPVLSLFAQPVAKKPGNATRHCLLVPPRQALSGDRAGGEVG